MLTFQVSLHTRITLLSLPLLVAGGLVPAAQAAITHVQTVGVSAGGGTSATVNIAATTAGDLLLVGINASGGKVTAVTDNKSDTFTAAASITTSGEIFAIYYAKNIAAGVTSVKVTYPYGGSVVMVAEYGGLDTSAPLDQTASHSNGYNGGTAYTSGLTKTTSLVPELAWGFSGNIYSALPVWTPAAGWTARLTVGNSFAQEQILSATGAYAASGTISVSSSDYNIGSLIATFKAAGGTPPPPPDTTPPTVSVLSPLNGANVSGTVAVTATASDNVAVASVQLKLDGANLGPLLTAAPYTVSWDTTKRSNAAHTITATALDTSGNAATATPVSVTVFNATAPAISSFFASPSSIPSGTSTTLVWAVTGNPAPSLSITGLGSVSGTSVQVSPAATATYTLTAANSAGTATAQTTVTVTPPDTTPPTVAITAPAAGSTVTGVVSVTANASDNVAVASVQFQLDGAALGAAITNAPYTYSWNTASTADGSHTLTAVATDTSHNSATSSPVKVTVSNTQPPVISSFVASPQTIASGGSSTLSWSVSAATSLAISGIGTVTGASTVVSPAQTTTYTLTATNSGGSATAQATVTVGAAGAVNIILDSDMANDCDDAGDHALLWSLVKTGEANVLALITSSVNDYSAPTVRAIANYYGHPDVPIGAYQGNTPNNYSAANSAYTQAVASLFDPVPGDTRANYPDAVTVYRQALAGAPNGSVYIVAGGYYEPLSGLLQSPADAISPLTGVQLVAQKVAALVPAAGYFPDSGTDPTPNFAYDADGASYVFANWPTPIVSVGSEVGGDVITGPAANASEATNPIKLAYDLVCGEGQWCPNAVPAWTQVAILYVVRGGIGTTFTMAGTNGHTVVWDNSQATPGRDIWTQTPNTGDSYIEKIISSGAMANILNPLIQSGP